MYDHMQNLRDVFSRRAAELPTIRVRDADPEKNGNAFENGVSVFVDGSAGRAQLRVGMNIAELIYDEFSASTSIHPVPELASVWDGSDGEVHAAVEATLSSILRHVNRTI